ncbi:hypothetical protein [Massilia sp. YIM B04103]|uniref:hypothetical protein n=1 Tax=Massilia sp. YIM B04103 TaxID=2963106 RepID=UPI00210EEBF1|nr:hypothetical protein [Massilia sp. YIM B04103]
MLKKIEQENFFKLICINADLKQGILYVVPQGRMCDMLFIPGYGGNMNCCAINGVNIPLSYGTGGREAFRITLPAGTVLSTDSASYYFSLVGYEY